MAPKRKTCSWGWGVFGGKHKKDKRCSKGIFRSQAQKKASSKRKRK